MKKKTENRGSNYILVQLKKEDGTTLTTFNGEPHHVELLKDYITNVFYNEGGGMTIWIEVPVGNWI